VQALPISYDGGLKTANQLKWIAKRRVKEKQMMKLGPISCLFEGIDLPGRNDVVLGRGVQKTVHQNNPGNRCLGSLVLPHMDEYQKACKLRKPEIAFQVIMSMQQNGARFLKQNQNGWWEEVPDEVAQEKVCMTFRETRRKARRSTVTGERKRPRTDQNCDVP
jgi:hypothetical protein